VRIGATLIPEPLNINDNDAPVNGKPLVLHLTTRPEQGRDTLSLLQA
jgi:hypothetical protein